ncbi:alpha/beta fold hydrolase [Natrinema gelatinilyticum]|uniref:alpha/beta fold hydrolase n=1 Tax=Natrinema gelatinilyticum TaxID=2961571 RepID=UPI0020C2A390|nr:alpha/beta fold hydrolase [Natrinema gelatinilyticum]
MPFFPADSISAALETGVRKSPSPRAKPPFLTRRSAAADVGRTPHEEIYAENKLSLVRYDSLTDWTRDIPVVLVSAIINRPYILDLQPDRSVVRRFLERGFEVYLVDWGSPSELDSSLGIDDYVGRYLSRCVDEVIGRVGCDSIHLFGYCTGGTLSAIFAALSPRRVHTLGLLAPVLNFDADKGTFPLWEREESYSPKRVADVYRNAPGTLLTFEFSLIAPFEYHLGRYLRLFDRLDDEAYVDHVMRRLRWGFDSVDVPGRLYRQFLVDLYRENKLQTGRLTVEGKNVDVDAIDMPIVNVIGSADQFIPPEASLPFLDTTASEDIQVIEFPTDHVGLSVGRASHEDLWPRVCEWFEGHS